MESLSSSSGAAAAAAMEEEEEEEEEERARPTVRNTGAAPLLIFDFDHSLIDCNSDPWVVQELGAADLMRSLRPSLPWTNLMDRMMSELHARGHTVTDIEASLRRIPVEPAMRAAIRAAHSWGWELQVISDANVFFIKTVLQKEGMEQYFKAIHSNLAYVDELGALRICPYHHSHLCPLCPPNMCKGTILDQIRGGEHLTTKERIVVYIGDGGGDYCPSLRLQQGDHVLARKGYPLWTLLQQSIDLVAAELHAWSSAHDIEEHLLNIYQTIGQTSM